MKRIAVTLLVIVAFAGCKQQDKPQWQGGGQEPVAYPGGSAPSVMPGEINRLKAIAESSPKNVNAWIALGNALMDSQRFLEAVDAYQKALALDPKNVDARVDMGTCYRGIGQPERALEEYRAAVKINPRHLNAHRNSGVVLAYDLNRRAEAVKEFEKYLELAPNAPDAVDIRKTIEQLKPAK
jgi:tetratricopeptide (TPR) repeat protein